MAFEWCKFALSVFFPIIDILVMGVAVFGINRFDRALSRVHVTAMENTLGILFVIVGLMVIRGLSMDSSELLLFILFFWVASPISGHMISHLEVAANENLTDLPVIDADEQLEKKEESE